MESTRQSDGKNFSRALLPSWPQYCRKARSRILWPKKEEINLLKSALKISKIYGPAAVGRNLIKQYWENHALPPYNRKQIIPKLQQFMRWHEEVKNSSVLPVSPHHRKLFGIAEKLWGAKENYHEAAATTNNDKPSTQNGNDNPLSIEGSEMVVETLNEDTKKPLLQNPLMEVGQSSNGSDGDGLRGVSSGA